ncbi:amidase [Marinithermofilum abyssi]|uniref:Amidase n=1 Tax=Marinithermofilum abyssi TaxID=1571185 RepID=A0A8J2VJQ2_9BACL|nr:amidase [Marinithermofilum abyssi]GGE29262.1 amidase [Marinithermofilum abyssi]
MELLRRSAGDMMAGLQQKEFSSLELVRAHIERIQSVNPSLNALVCERFERALQEAREADQRRLSFTAGDAPPLLGMPITIKETMDVEGLPTTGGVPKQLGRMASRDAEVVRRLRYAGAIVLGKTNVSTLTMAHETDNLLYGRTNHPLSSSRTPGGSSGGEAALIASGGSPWGIGTDLGGSVRLPAHFCGIAGLRPTHGLIPHDGEYPSIPHHGHMNSIGPMARTAGDVRLLYTVMVGKTLATPSVSSIPIVWAGGFPGYSVDREVLAGMTDTVGRLEQALRRTIPERFPSFVKKAFQYWQDMILQDGGAFIGNEVREDAEFYLWKEWLRFFTGRKRTHLWVLQLMLGGKLFRPSPQKVKRFPKLLQSFREEFQQITDGQGVLLCPVYPRTAPRHGGVAQMVYNNLGSRVLPYLVMPNALGYPAMSVPIGQTKKGLPFGIQIVGNPRQEERVITVAEMIEHLCREDMKAQESTDQAI